MANIKTYEISEPYLKLKNQLGEGPYYLAETKTLRWVDVDSNQVHTLNIEQGPSSHKIFSTTDFPVSVTAEIENESEHFLYGGQDHIGLMDKTTGQTRRLKDIYESNDAEAARKRDRLRLNDGYVDPQGRFWVGSMVRPQLAALDMYGNFPHEGTLYRLDPDLSLHRMLESQGIPNGMSWTKDQKTMYYTDSLRGIHAYDFSPSGDISSPRHFYQWQGPGVGCADGHVMDEEEHLWVAIFGGGHVVRVNPKGEVVAKIKLPSYNITCPVFVEDELFIVTADEDHSLVGTPTDGKFGGSMYRCKVGIRGMKKNEFRLK